MNIHNKLINVKIYLLEFNFYKLNVNKLNLYIFFSTFLL